MGWVGQVAQWVSAKQTSEYAQLYKLAKELAMAKSLLVSSKGVVQEKMLKETTACVSRNLNLCT